MSPVRPVPFVCPFVCPDSQARFVLFLTKSRFVLTTEIKLVNVGLVTFVQSIRLRKNHLTSHAPLTLITPLNRENS